MRFSTTPGRLDNLTYTPQKLDEIVEELKEDDTLFTISCDKKVRDGMIKAARDKKTNLFFKVLYQESEIANYEVDASTVRDYIKKNIDIRDLNYSIARSPYNKAEAYILAFR